MTLTPLQALARATSALVSRHDVTDALATLLGDAQESLSAAAAGMLVATPSGELEVLAATSHHALDLELYQAQEQHGPCADAVTGNAAVLQDDGPDLEERWPDLAPKMHAAGYRAVQAHPLRWHGQAIGAINVFHHKSHLTADDVTLGQAFADIATLLLITPNELGMSEVTARTEAALAGRTIIEQAKGVLAQQNSISVEHAYTMLIQLARMQGTSLTEAATGIVRNAYQT